MIKPFLVLLLSVLINSVSGQINESSIKLIVTGQYPFSYYHCKQITTVDKNGNIIDKQDAYCSQVNRSFLFDTDSSYIIIDWFGHWYSISKIDGDIKNLGIKWQKDLPENYIGEYQNQFKKTNNSYILQYKKRISKKDVYWGKDKISLEQNNIVVNYDIDSVVKNNIKADVKLLTDSLYVNTFGERCDILGSPPSGRVSINYLIACNRIKLVRQVLYGNNSVGKMYVIEALLTLNIKEKILNDAELTTIKEFIESDVSISTCAGCSVSESTTRAIFEKLKYKKLLRKNKIKLNER